MDVEVRTSDPELVSAKDVAVALVSGLVHTFHVRSVTVIDRDTGRIVDAWEGGV
jgi:hypothetical protein